MRVTAKKLRQALAKPASGAHIDEIESPFVKPQGPKMFGNTKDSEAFDPTKDPDRALSRAEIVDWLTSPGENRLGMAAFFEQLCLKLNETGVPVMRAMLSLQDRHPQIAARVVRWERGEKLHTQSFPLAEVDSPDYLNSPIFVIHEGASSVRRKLEGDPAEFDFDLLHELREIGATDYVAMALVFSDGSRHFVSWMTGQPGGFTVEQLAFLDKLMPLIRLRVELDHTQRIMSTFLTTYLGKGASERITAGTIHRNQGEELSAVLLFCDLRNFTAMADRLAPADVITILGEYYEAVAEPVEQRGGDIIKLMGDGLLCLFPYDPDDSGDCETHTACRAVESVRAAHARVLQIDPSHFPPDVGHLQAGFALHTGRVTFGNVGSRERLDFTAIGRAVNEVVRVEQLTKTLNHPVLATKAFADLHCEELVSVGHHHLRGVADEKELFALWDLMAPKA